MTLRHEPAHPVDLTNFTRGQLQALADDVTGRLLVGTVVTSGIPGLEGISGIPDIQKATQHGLTLSEATNLVDTFENFQALAAQVEFDDTDTAIFEAPFPGFTVIRKKDEFSGSTYSILSFNQANGVSGIILPLSVSGPNKPQPIAPLELRKILTSVINGLRR
jgi:hypothetical protein